MDAAPAWSNPSWSMSRMASNSSRERITSPVSGEPWGTKLWIPGRFEMHLGRLGLGMADSFLSLLWFYSPGLTFVLSGWKNLFDHLTIILGMVLLIVKKNYGQMIK